MNMVLFIKITVLLILLIKILPSLVQRIYNMFSGYKKSFKQFSKHIMEREYLGASLGLLVIITATMLYISVGYGFYWCLTKFLAI